MLAAELARYERRDKGLIGERAFLLLAGFGLPGLRVLAVASAAPASA